MIFIEKNGSKIYWLKNNSIIHELEIQLHKKEEEIHYLVRQLDYVQTKYRQKKMQMSALKNSLISNSSHQSNFRVKAEREIDMKAEKHNWSIHNYGGEVDYLDNIRDANHREVDRNKKSSDRKNHKYERSQYSNY